LLSLHYFWQKYPLITGTVVWMQQVPEKSKESPGGPWEFVGLLNLFDPPRHDSAETIRRALNLGVNVKMITGNFLLFDNLFSECNGDYLFFYVVAYFMVILISR
jgi:hypothetical protein